MKKLIMAAVIAVAAIGANAATVNWQATKGYLYNGTTTTKVTSGEAYLMYVTAAYTQADLVSDFYAAKGNATATLTAMGESGALATGAGSIGTNGRITVTESTSTLAGADGSVYFVVFNDDKMFVSGVADAEYDNVMGTSSAAFASITAASQTALDANAAYSTAGWYSIPEPTSGLLMMVGCALLALRRKRA